MPGENVQQLVESMRLRSWRIRRWAQVQVLMIIVVAAVTLGFFFTTAQYIPNAQGGKQVTLKVLGFEFSTEDVYRGLPHVGEAASSPTQIEDALRRENASLREKSTQAVLTINTIGSAILRIGSVILAVYVIQVMIHLTRYNFRIADHVSALADALVISNGDPKSIAALVNIFAPRHIGFGAPPATAPDKLADFITEAVKTLKPGAKADLKDAGAAATNEKA
jgi:hypothetical protein